MVVVTPWSAFTYSLLPVATPPGPTCAKAGRLVMSTIPCKRMHPKRGLIVLLMDMRFVASYVGGRLFYGKKARKVRSGIVQINGLEKAFRKPIQHLACWLLADQHTQYHVLLDEPEMLAGAVLRLARGEHTRKFDVTAAYIGAEENAVGHQSEYAQLQTCTIPC